MGRQPEDVQSGLAAIRGRGGPWGLIIAVVVLAVVGCLVVRIPEVRESLSPQGAIHGRLRGLGWMSYPAFAFLTAALIAVGVPRLIFCPLAGAAFGFWGGLAACTTATLAAYFASFLWIRRRLAKEEPRGALPPMLSFLRHSPGIPGVILARLVPVPGQVGTVALSVSKVRPGAYVVGSLIGVLPQAIPLVLVGAGLLSGDPRAMVATAVAALVVVSVAYLTLRWWLKRASFG